MVDVNPGIAVGHCRDMNLHAAFLDRIQSESDPRLPQSIYADWLEEQGDPRAELLRLAVEVATNYRRMGYGYQTDDPRFLPHWFFILGNLKVTWKGRIKNLCGWMTEAKSVRVWGACHNRWYWFRWDKPRYILIPEEYQPLRN